MKRLAIYARVSTDQQTVEPQLHALREYALRRAWEPVEYVDVGVSGAKDRRLALDQLLADCRKRNVDAVAVVRLDRLARSVRYLVTLAGELEALGIDLIATEQSIDTSTPVGRFTFTTLGAVAELERDLIRERVVAGVAAARRKGTRLGRPPAADPATVRVALERGMSVAALARQLGVSRTAVRTAARAR